MTGPANIKHLVLPASVLAALAVTAAVAVQGWAAHGEAIFLAMLEGGFLTCF